MINKRLSPHFTLHEAARSQTAARHGIDNTPPVSVHPRLEALAQTVLEPVRAHFRIPFSPSSWYRSPALERVLTWRSFVRWAKHRQLDPDEVSAWEFYLDRKSHPRGEAADIELPGIPNHVLAEWIRDNLTFDQLILEFHKIGQPHSGWVHVSFSSEHNRRQVLTIGSGGTREGLPTYR